MPCPLFARAEICLRTTGAALAAAAMLGACTVYREFDPATGNKITEFRTSANFNVVTSEVLEDDNQVGLGFQSGKARQDRLLEMRESAAASAGPAIHAGGLIITGTVDHSTGTREWFAGARGLAKSLVALVLGSKAITATAETIQAKTAANAAADGARITGANQIEMASEANRHAEAIQAANIEAAALP